MTRLRVVKLTAAAAAATVALSGCGFKGLYDAQLPGGANVGSHPFTVTAEFADVLDLVPQSNVKVNDVAVGKVEKIELDGWVAKVTMQVNRDVKLPSNARAAIRMTSLLGEKYVDLEQPVGDSSPVPLGNNSNIPLTSTGTAPEVEEVLGALSLLLNGGGLQQLRTITTELNKALSGNEAAVKSLLSQLNIFVGGLDKQKNDITTALDKIDQLAATLNRQKQTLVAALDTFPQALQILKDNRTQLVDLLQGLSNLGGVATRVIDATQTKLVTSLKTLSPILQSLTAASDDIPKALQIMLSFPFPLGATREFVKGDYANLNAVLNLNLSDQLCGLNKSLCGLSKVLPSSSGGVAPSNTTTNSAGASQLPTLIGAGG